MACMASTFDARRVAGWFRLVAFAEAFTWVGLLIGMYFKYLGTPRTEVGVHVFGMAHGIVFVAFVGAALLCGRAFEWRPGMWVLALLASVIPLASVVFLTWVERTGRLGARAGAVASPPPTETT